MNIQNFFFISYEQLTWTILGQYTVGMSHLDKNPLGLKSHLDKSHHLDNSPLGQ